MNKIWMKASDDAFNERIMDRRSLRFAPDMSVRIDGQEPIDSNAYRRYMEMLLDAFPDFRYENDPYELILGESDWTCTIAEVMGTDISLNMCRICRWRDSEIVEMQVFAAFAGRLGIG